MIVIVQGKRNRFFHYISSSSNASGSYFASLSLTSIKSVFFCCISFFNCLNCLLSARRLSISLFRYFIRLFAAFNFLTTSSLEQSASSSSNSSSSAASSAAWSLSSPSLLSCSLPSSFGASAGPSLFFRSAKTASSFTFRFSCLIYRGEEGWLDLKEV